MGQRLLGMVSDEDTSGQEYWVGGVGGGVSRGGWVVQVASFPVTVTKHLGKITWDE